MFGLIVVSTILSSGHLRSDHDGIPTIRNPQLQLAQWRRLSVLKGNHGLFCDQGLLDVGIWDVEQLAQQGRQIRGRWIGFLRALDPGAFAQRPGVVKPSNTMPRSEGFIWVWFLFDQPQSACSTGAKHRPETYPPNLWHVSRNIPKTYPGDKHAERSRSF